MKNAINMLLAPIVLAALLLFPALSSIVGCKSSPQQIAAKTEGVIIPGVNGAMYAWRDYVKGTNGVTQKQADQVKDVYLKYYNSQLVASNAFVNFFMANSGDNTNATAIAKANLDAALKTAADSQAEIVTLVNSLITKKQAHGNTN